MDHTNCSVCLASVGRTVAGFWVEGRGSGCFLGITLVQVGWFDMSLTEELAESPGRGLSRRTKELIVQQTLVNVMDRLQERTSCETKEVIGVVLLPQAPFQQLQ